MTQRPKKRGPGRPPLGSQSATELVKLRVAPDVARRWRAEAESAELSLSEWIRQRCAS